jgi:hypothetical protein
MAVKDILRGYIRRGTTPVQPDTTIPQGVYVLKGKESGRVEKVGKLSDGAVLSTADRIICVNPQEYLKLSQ